MTKTVPSILRPNASNDDDDDDGEEAAITHHVDETVIKTIKPLPTPHFFGIAKPMEPVAGERNHSSFLVFCRFKFDKLVECYECYFDQFEGS